MQCHWKRACQMLIALALALLAAPPAAAQRPAQVPRIGFLSPGSPSDPRWQRYLEAFRQGLRELGYVEGQTMALEPRWAEEQYDRLPGLAAELVRLKADVILAATTPAVRPARDATRTTPIIILAAFDPVAAGLVASLARPGGNVTGVTLMAPELVGKQLQLLQEVVPKVPRVALLWNPANVAHPPQVREAEGAARTLGVRLQPLGARGPEEIDRAFAAMTRERAGAALVLVDVMLIDQRTRIVNLAAKRRLPVVFGLREGADAGALMAYGANVADMYRRTATYVDKILKGAKPADLPVEQPTTFELVVNLKTAKALGLTFPPSILVRAEQVIQ